VKIPLLESPAGYHRGPVATKCIWPNWTTYANAGNDDNTRTATSCTYKTWHTALLHADQIRLRYTNSGDTGSSEQDGPATITVKASILYDGTIYPVTWGGATSKTIVPGSQADSDDIAGLELPAGADFHVLTYVTAPSAGQWPASHDIKALSHGAGYEVGVDRTATGVVTGTGHDGWAYGPGAITGIATERPRIRAVAVVGDSIASTVDTSTSDEAFIVRALLALGAPYIRLATSGDSFSGFQTSNGSRRRLALIADLCSEAICEYGANDMRGPENNSLASVQGWAITSWQHLRDSGVHRVHQTTTTPFSTGTSGSQSRLDPNDTVRESWNAWLRAGAPIDPTTHAAVAIGTPGARLAGTGDHPLSSVIETADAVESARDSGVWAPAYFDDGVHPNTNGRDALAAVIEGATVAQNLNAESPSPSRLLATAVTNNSIEFSAA
jgi:lysophospholipase L1-like esterase